jgi:transposase
MALCKPIDTHPRLVVVDLSRQLLPWTFERALNHRLAHEVDLSYFDAVRERQDWGSGVAIGAPAQGRLGITLVPVLPFKTDCSRARRMRGDTVIVFPDSSEPPRDCRRLLPLRGWSHVKKQRELPGSRQRVRKRAVRIVHEQRAQHGSEWGAMRSIAEKIGCSAETLPNWVRQSERDNETRPGVTMDERQRLRELEGVMPVGLQTYHLHGGWPPGVRPVPQTVSALICVGRRCHHRAVEAQPPLHTSYPGTVFATKTASSWPGSECGQVSSNARSKG